MPRTPRPLRRARPALAAAALTAAALLPLAPAQALEPAARIAGHAIIGPSGNAGSVVAAGPAGRRATAVGGLRQAGATVGRIRLRLDTTTAGAASEARGTVTVRDVVLLDGRVVIAALRMTVSAAADEGSAAAGIVAHDVEGLVVDGVPTDAVPGTAVPLPGAGVLVFFEAATSEAGVRANALRLAPSGPSALYGVAPSLVIGHLDATATAGDGAAPPPAVTAAPPPVITSAPQAPPPAASTPAPAAVPPPPVVEAVPPPPPTGLPRRSAPDIAPQGPGYVFPVFGEASFTDDWGAPRAGTGTHQGNDLFAPIGTPVLAVSDGTLDRVGVNTLGGNRLWLTDDAGNQFYYAHLSAYAPAAVEGARVRAGQVIAFVGNTGQAITTPPHLHFEIHPGGGAAVNPYPFLLAWRRADTAPVAALVAAAPVGEAPAEGAVIVDVTPERDVAPPGGDGTAVPVS